MTHFSSIHTAFIALAASTVLAGCNSSPVTPEATDTSQPAVTVTPSTGTTAPTTPGTTTQATAVTATLQETSLAPSVAAVLTLDTATNTVGSLAGTYTPSTQRVTAGTGTFAVAANGNSYVGSITGGGNNQVVALQTPAADMPTSGSATYTGTANIAYLDTPSTRLFDGTMAATVTATFTTAGGTVDVALSTPSGTFGGAAYTGPGQAQITDLTINGSTYASSASSTASVTGFTGATGLNSGAQTVTAQGVFGGPTANETGATAVIQDGANGQALISLTAR